MRVPPTPGWIKARLIAELLDREPSKRKLVGVAIKTRTLSLR
jgi:hypothetical protein